MLCSPTPPVSVDGDERFAKLLSKDEDQLLKKNKKKLLCYFNSTCQTVKKKKPVKTKKLPDAGSDSALPLSSCKAPNPA